MTTPVGSIRLDLTIDGSGLSSEIIREIRTAMEPTLAALRRDLNEIQREWGQTARAAQDSGAKQTAAAKATADAVEDIGDEHKKAGRAAEKSSAVQMAAAKAVAKAVGDIGDKYTTLAGKAVLSSKAQTAAIESVTHALGEQALAAKAASAAQSTRQINAVTRALDRQAAAWTRVAAAQTAAAAAPTPSGPPSGGGGGGGGGSGGTHAGGFMRGGKGRFGFLSSPVGLNLGALGASAVPAAMTAVTNLTGAVQALGQAGLALPGIFAGIASSVGVAAVGFSGMGDAIKLLNEAAASGDWKDMEKASAALKNLAPAAAETAKSVSSFTQGPWKDLQKATSQRMLTGVATEFDSFVGKTMPRVERGFGGIADSWNGTLKELLRVGGTDSTGSIMDRIFGNTAEGQKRANAAIEPLVKGFGTLTAAGTDFLPRLGDGLAKLGTRFSDFITKADGDGRLAGWIDTGFKAASNFGEALLNIGKIITDITGAAGGDGGFLKWLRDVTGSLRAFTSSDEGQAKLTKFFQEGKAKLDQWLPVLRDIGSIALDVFKGFQQWGDVLLPILGQITGFLSGLGGEGGGLIGGVLTGFLAFKTLSPFVGLLGGLGKVDGLLGGINTKAGGLKGKLGGLGPGLSLLAGGVLSQTDGSNGLGVLSTIGGGALLGANFGPVGAAFGALGGAAIALTQTFINQSNRIDDINRKHQESLDARPPASPAMVAPLPTPAGPAAAVAPNPSIVKPSATAQGGLAGILVPQGLQGVQVGPFGTGAPVQVPQLQQNMDAGLAQVAEAAREATSEVGQLTDGINRLPQGEVSINGNTPEVIKQLEVLGYRVKDLPNGNLQINVQYRDPLGLVTSGGIGGGVGLTTIDGRPLFGRADGGVIPRLGRGFAGGGVVGGGAGVGSDWVRRLLEVVGRGGMFNPSMVLDTSTTSVAPPFDPNRMAYEDYLRLILEGAGMGLRAGGVLPGYSPRVDNMLVPMSGGEGVLIPEAVRGIGGAPAVYAINSMFRSGLSRRGYADGGVLPGALPGLPGDPVVALLTQIRDLLAGKGGSGPLVDTAQAVGTMASSGGGRSGVSGTTAFDPVKGAIEGAMSALGFPQQLIDQATGKSALSASGGLAGGTANYGGYAAALTAFAQSGSVSDVTGLGLDANDTVVKAIATARNKKKGALGGDAIAGLVNQVLTGGGFTGTLDSTNTPLVTALQTFREKLGKGAGTTVPNGMAMIPAVAVQGSKAGLQPAAAQLFDLIATQFPQIREIGGVRDDPIPDHPSGRALDIMIPGGTTRGGANPAGKALGDQMWAMLNANGLIDPQRSLWQTDQGGDHFNHIHALAAEGATAGLGGMPLGMATAPGLPGANLATTGAPIPVWVVNFGGGTPGVPGMPGVPGPLGAPVPGQPGTFPGSPVVQAGFGAVGAAGSDVAGSLLSAILQGTNFDIGTPTGPGTDLAGLVKERNPLAAASAFGYDVPDYTRQGGEGAVENDPNAPSFDAKGRMFSDTGTLIDRTMTDLQTQMKAQFDQTLAVFDQIKNQLGEEVLGPLMQTAIQEGINGLGDKVTSQIGQQLGNTAGPIIAQAVKAAIPAQAAPAGGAAVGGGMAQVVTGVIGMADGGPVYGGVPGRDSVPALLMPGEHVFNTADVARMGGQAGVYQFRQALAAGTLRGFATGGGVIGNDTVGADFFGVSQIPIIGVIVNLLVRVLLKMIGVEIEVRDTLDEMSSEVRQFRGEFEKFDATGRLMNDTSGLLDRTGSTEQAAADERIRILKIVIEGLIKFIIEKVIVPIGKAIANAAIQAGATAASGAITGAGGGPAGGIVGAAITSMGTALVEIGGELFSTFWTSLTPVLIDLIGEGLQTFLPDVMTTIFGGGLLAQIFSPITMLFDGISQLLGGGLAGIFGGLLGGLAFDNGGVASGVGLMPKATIRPERVLSPGQTVAFEQLPNRIDRLITTLEQGGRGGLTTGDMHFHGQDAPEQAHDRLMSLLGGG